jgi:hypothetical protein
VTSKTRRTLDIVDCFESDAFGVGVGVMGEGVVVRDDGEGIFVVSGGTR